MAGRKGDALLGLRTGFLVLVSVLLSPDFARVGWWAKVHELEHSKKTPSLDSKCVA